MLASSMHIRQDLIDEDGPILWDPMLKLPQQMFQQVLLPVLNPNLENYISMICKHETEVRL